MNTTLSKLNTILGFPAVRYENCAIHGRLSGVVLICDAAQAGNYMDLTGCANMESLGQLKSCKDLNVSDCNKLASLGELKSISGSLEMAIGKNYMMINGCLQQTK